MGKKSKRARPPAPESPDAVLEDGTAVFFKTKADLPELPPNELKKRKQEYVQFRCKMAACGAVGGNHPDPIMLQMRAVSFYADMAVESQLPYLMAMHQRSLAVEAAAEQVIAVARAQEEREARDFGGIVLQ